MEEFSTDYSNYLLNTNVEKEIQPICTNIDEMLTRLEEFESLLSIVKNDTATITQQHIPQLESFKGEFQDICTRLDNFENFLQVVTGTLDKLEEQVEVADEELGHSGIGIRGLLKPLLKSNRKSMDSKQSNLDADGNFKPVPIFETSDFFPDSTSC